MKVYVASKFERKDDVRAAYRLIEAAGHGVTHDWTQESIGNRTGEDLITYFRECAEADMYGVLMADAVIVIHDDRGRGMYVEIGAALARNIPVIVVGGLVSRDGSDVNTRIPIFYHMKEIKHVASVEEAIKAAEAWQVEAPRW